jgi:purine nucleosidase
MNATPDARRALIIDTDGGVDDAVALWWALTDPRIDVVAVTTVAGVVPVAAAAYNILLVLAAAGRSDIPVAIGADTRLGPSPQMRPASFIHGDDGLGNTFRPLAAGLRPVVEPASQLMLRLCRERPRAVSIVSLGPVTNLARAIAADPGWAACVAEYVAMAGSSRLGGNALPAGEANVAHDPSAMQAVVAAEWRKPPLLVGLDVTHKATLGEAEFALLSEGLNAAALFVDEPLRFYRTFGSSFTAPLCPCHDLLAVMALTDPAIITEAPVLPLAVQTQEGPAWGLTVVDFRAPVFARGREAEQARLPGFHDWRIALDVNVDGFRRNVRRLFGES